jgi:hypothetical protein
MLQCARLEDAGTHRRCDHPQVAIRGIDTYCHSHLPKEGAVEKKEGFNQRQQAEAIHDASEDGATSDSS